MEFLDEQDVGVEGVETIFVRFLEMLQIRGYSETEDGQSLQDLIDQIRPLSMEEFWNRYSWSDLNKVYIRPEFRETFQKVYTFFIPISKDEHRIPVQPVTNLLKTINDNFPHHIILASKVPLGSPTISKIAQFSNRNHRVESVLYDLLRVQPHLHYQTDAHRILTPDEARDLLSHLMVQTENLPFISIQDPLVRYYGLEPGQIIRFESNRPHVNNRLYYRAVVANDFKNQPVPQGEWYL